MLNLLINDESIDPMLPVEPSMEKLNSLRMVPLLTDNSKSNTPSRIEKLVGTTDSAKGSNGKNEGYLSSAVTLYSL